MKLSLTCAYSTFCFKSILHIYIILPNCFISQDESVGHDDSAGHSAGPDAAATGSVAVATDDSWPST